MEALSDASIDLIPSNNTTENRLPQAVFLFPALQIIGLKTPCLKSKAKFPAPDLDRSPRGGPEEV